MKYLKVYLFFLIIACFAFVSCADSTDTDDDQQQIKELKIYNWEDYLPEDVITDFEAEYGVDVTQEYFDDDEWIVSALESDPSRYDLIFPTHKVLYSLWNLKLLAEIDKTNIPNLENIDERYLNQSFDPDNRFSIPYDWGTTVLSYNSKFIEKEDITYSWQMLFNEKYSDRIATFDSPNLVVGMALKYLGYSINSRGDEQLLEAKDILLEQKQLIIGYLSWKNITDMMINEEIWIAPAYSGDAVMMLDENPDIDYFVPKEGSDYYVDCIAIPIAAKNKDLAEKFLDYVMRPDIQARITEYTGYGNPNKRSIEGGFISPETLADKRIYPEPDIMSKLESWDTQSETGSFGINSIWSELIKSEQ